MRRGRWRALSGRFTRGRRLGDSATEIRQQRPLELSSEDNDGWGGLPPWHWLAGPGSRRPLELSPWESGAQRFRLNRTHEVELTADGLEVVLFEGQIRLNWIDGSGKPVEAYCEDTSPETFDDQRKAMLDRWRNAEVVTVEEALQQALAEEAEYHNYWAPPHDDVQRDEDGDVSC